MSITLGTDGYCTAANVQSLHQQRTFGTTTKPTTTEVEGWITEGFHVINGTLDAVGYSIPVATTATQASKILLAVNVNYALARVELALYSAGLGGMPETAKALMDEVNRTLKSLRDGVMTLPDATTTTDLLAPGNAREPDGEFNLDDDGDERDPVFTRDGVY